MFESKYCSYHAVNRKEAFQAASTTDCPYCEIDRLTAQLAEANERCRLLDEKAGDWQHRYAQETMRLQSQLAERDAEIVRLKESEEVLTDCLNGSSKAMYTAEMYDKLRTENAALREEVERLKEIGNRRLMHCNQCGSDLIVDICSAGKSIHTTDIRKHTAREILQLLDNADWACSTYEETYYQAVCAIKSKFGLEG